MANDCRCRAGTVHGHLWFLPGEPQLGKPQPTELCESRQMKFDDVRAKGDYWVCFLEAKNSAGPLSRTKYGES